MGTAGRGQVPAATDLSAVPPTPPLGRLPRHQSRATGRVLEQLSEADQARLGAPSWTSPRRARTSWSGRVAGAACSARRQRLLGLVADIGHFGQGGGADQIAFDWIRDAGGKFDREQMLASLKGRDCSGLTHLRIPGPPRRWPRHAGPGAQVSRAPRGSLLPRACTAIATASPLSAFQARRRSRARRASSSASPYSDDTSMTLPAGRPGPLCPVQPGTSDRRAVEHPWRGRIRRASSKAANAESTSEQRQIGVPDPQQPARYGADRLYLDRSQPAPRKRPPPPSTSHQPSSGFCST